MTLTGGEPEAKDPFWRDGERHRPLSLNLANRWKINWTPRDNRKQLILFTKTQVTRSGDIG
jgi:hypothetical protein